ncbi:hypothetical protein V6N11_021301 [Hibiscus sabdariffa]|uniref:MADS-box domain-containing protein n=1 Tax=Hibiscus sabdariffa TaxID=183260 RepID=A0ABR2NM02_9ROSI
MGRVKLKIKKLENTNGRQATYAKRKHGIMKKANELSILCDVETILLMFSPTNKPSLCIGKRCSFEEIIEKFAQLTPQERAKRKLESLEALKKTFKKSDHDVNIHEFLGTSTHTVEDLTNQARLLHSRLSEIHRRLSCWTEIDNINNVDHLGQMEDSLKESLNQIRAHKENLGKQQLLPLECTSQFQNDMYVPLRMGIEQQLQSLAWIPNNDCRPMALPEDPNLIPHRDVECSASSSFGSYSGYFSTPKSSELSSSGQENGILNDLQLGPDMTQTKAVGLLLLALVLLPYLTIHYIPDMPATKLRCRKEMLPLISSTKAMEELGTMQCGIKPDPRNSMVFIAKQNWYSVDEMYSLTAQHMDYLNSNKLPGTQKTMFKGTVETSQLNSYRILMVADKIGRQSGKCNRGKTKH